MKFLGSPVLSGMTSEKEVFCREFTRTNAAWRGIVRISKIRGLGF
jgi:hypothetical protein